jgi:hypothetical protein
MGSKNAARGVGALGLGAPAVIVCCAGPALAIGAFGALTLGAVAGVGVGALALAGVIVAVVMRVRRRGRCATNGSAGE